MSNSFQILDRECDRAGVSLAERNYYHVTMRRESSGIATAKARTSSASGVFQFIDQTWLATLKEHGADHGYAAQAALITRGSDGRLRAPQSVMDLRFDVVASTRMMMEFTGENRERLVNGMKAAGQEDFQPRGGDLYLAHFLGPGRIDDPRTAGNERKGALGVLTMPASTELADIPFMASTISANRSIAHFNVGQLRAWAAAKFDGRVDEVRAYDTAVAARGDRAMTPEEIEAERVERENRRNSLRILGRTEDEIDEMDERGDLMGAGFLLVLGSILSALFSISQDEVTLTYDVPIISAPAGYDTEVAATPASPSTPTITDTRVVAAVAGALPTTTPISGASPASAATSPPVQFANLPRPTVTQVNQPAFV